MQWELRQRLRGKENSLGCVYRESGLKSPKIEVVTLPGHQCGRWRCEERTEEPQVIEESRLKETIRVFRQGVQGKLSLNVFQGCLAPASVILGFKFKKSESVD